MPNLIDIDQALSLISNNNSVVTAMAACEPYQFFSKVHEGLKEIENITIFCANPSENFPIFQNQNLQGKLQVIPMFLTAPIRKSQGHGVVHYYPHHLSKWVHSISKRGPVDVFWGTCSPPDSRGFVSLGLSASYETEILRDAKIAILEVNPNMPVTYGATQISADEIDYFISSARQLPTLDRESKVDVIDQSIAQHIYELVPDGATIQLGIGSIPDAVGYALEHKKNLGIHTEMFNESMMNLYLKGIVTGQHKTIWPRKMIAAFALGSRKLYDFLNENPIVEFHPASVVNDPYRIGRNYKMISINSAVEIDLTGQVCSESIGHTELSGVGGAADTHVGAQRSEGGRGIIALHSVTRSNKSKIVFELTPGAKVSISRNDVDTIVTEYGIAELQGKSVAERAKAMIAVAHPQYREDLTQKALAAYYI